MAVNIQPVPKGQYGEETRRFLDILRRTLSSFDHGDLAGLSDDDHTIYSLVDGTRAFTGTVSGVTPTAGAHLATKSYVDAAIGAPGAYDHTLLTSIGTNTHAQIDTHIADSTIHFTESSINHANILNIGTNSHAAIDTHIADGTIHFTMLDEDDMLSNSATQAATQQSIAAYVTSSISAIDFWTRTGTTLNPKTSTDSVEWDHLRYEDATTGGTDNIFLGPGISASNTGLRNCAIGHNALRDLTSGSNNMAFGESCLVNVESGGNNVGIGRAAGASLVTGSGNMFIGQNAGNSVLGSFNAFIGDSCGVNSTSSSNVGIGQNACRSLTNSGNVGIGNNTLYNAGNVVSNVAIGLSALRGSGAGTYSRNVGIGRESGYSMSTGDDNVLLGYQSGYGLTTESNRLIIENSNDISTPLIYGEFDNDLLKFNSSLEVTKAVRKSAVETITASSDTLDDTNYTVNCDCSSNNITINLPTASGNTGLEYVIGKVDSTGNIVTVDPNSTETVMTSSGAVSTITITVQGTFVKLMSDGTNWIMVSQG